MGLDWAPFGIIRSNILPMSPSPYFSNAYSLILQEEIHYIIARTPLKFPLMVWGSRHKFLSQILSFVAVHLSCAQILERLDIRL